MTVTKAPLVCVRCSRAEGTDHQGAPACEGQTHRESTRTLDERDQLGEIERRLRAPEHEVSVTGTRTQLLTFNSGSSKVRKETQGMRDGESS